MFAIPEEKSVLVLECLGIRDKDKSTPSKLVKEKVRRSNPKSKEVHLLFFSPSFFPPSLPSFFPFFLLSFKHKQYVTICHIQTIFLQTKEPNLIIC